MKTAPAPWLVVIDMQRCFADQESDWAVPEYETITPHVTRLIKASNGRVVFTRFVSGPTDTTGWAAYYSRWPAMQKPENHLAWKLTIDPPPHAQVVTQSTFSKWASLAAAIPRDAPIVMCGVATEVCVLSTVLDAVDDGRSVLVAPEACAGATVELHASALRILEDFAPNVAISHVDAAASMLSVHE